MSLNSFACSFSNLLYIFVNYKKGLAGNSPGFGEFAYTMASLPNSKGGICCKTLRSRILASYAFDSSFVLYIYRQLKKEILHTVI
jgi:hypothetical protein